MAHVHDDETERAAKWLMRFSDVLATCGGTETGFFPPSTERLIFTMGRAVLASKCRHVLARAGANFHHTQR